MIAHKRILKMLICLILLITIFGTSLSGESLLLKISYFRIASFDCSIKYYDVFLNGRAAPVQSNFLMKNNIQKNHQKDTLKNGLTGISKQLEKIFEDDQKYRIELEQLNNQTRSSTTGQDSIWRLINRQDSINLSKVEEIIKKYGWLGLQQVGEKGSMALFFVLQHADLQIQEKYLPVLEKAVDEKKASVSNFAYFIDRIEMRTGKPQTYGTQTTILDNECFVYPIKDLTNLNKRREEAGLSSIDESFKGRNVKYNLSPLTKIDEKKRDYLLDLLNNLSNENKKNVDQYITVLKKYGKNSKEEMEQKRIKLNANLKLLSSIESILDIYGWPGYTTIGMPGSSTIFSILSQADATTIEKYLPLLKSTVEKGEASSGYLAFLEDKIEVANGRPQIYGTQINSNKRPFPIEDEKNVDDRRKKLGLLPLQDYLKHTYGIDYPVKH